MLESPIEILLNSSNGVQVCAHDYGGNGPDVLFCHATGFHGRYWDPICSTMRKNFRCVSVDLRGHGNSLVPNGVSMNWMGMAEDVLSTIDYLNLGSPFAVGHSMGGSSILLAEQLRPGTFKAGWLFEPIVIGGETITPEMSKGGNLAVLARKRKETFQSREEAFERYVSRPPFSTCDEEALRAYVNYGFRDHGDEVILKCRGEIEAQVFENSVTTIFDALSTVNIPITVAGSSDQDGPAAIAPQIASQLPKGNFELYQDLTHFAPMENPSLIAEGIMQTLNKVL
ncbi:MAG: alpha/beta hydrolase [Acidimicrobiales bacterium]|nr:alpha/beta hydrolase [Acidimicrobiales bacterium]MDP6298098.1 alpha/beta hydrolase [Acidimicrobiales bacterium]HJM29380.1 alpha/beta hydrolase [Acidimicrobiales bacterium]HJM96828.1 alpha/beta hydrolase [Acidimicrobiales bacterium]